MELLSATIKEYFKYQKELENKWGEKSIVLMQIGSFYEMYGISTENLNIGKAKEASQILSMQLTRKNKNLKPSETNPYLVGFPDVSLSIHLSKLLRENYTVAVYNQRDAAGVKNKVHDLVKIYSPTVYIDEYSESNILFVLEALQFKCPITLKMLKNLNLVIFDSGTGVSSYYQFFETPDSVAFESEMQRLIQIYSPKEMVITSNSFLKEFLRIKVLVKEFPKEYGLPSYQNGLFQKIFNFEDTIQTPLELLNLESKPDIARLLAITFQYVWEFDPLILNKIKKPECLEYSKNLILNRDSINQLHLDALYRLIDKTKTPMGSRLLKKRLFNPLIDSKQINDIYDKTSYFMEHNINLELLQEIGDLEKKTRKIITNSFKSYELLDLKNSLEAVSNLFSDDNIKKLFKIEKVESLLNYLENTFDFSQIKKKEDNIFLENVNVELDSLEKEYTLSKSVFERIASAFNEINKGFKVGFTDNYGYYLQTTKKVWRLFDKFKITYTFDNVEYTLTEEDVYQEILSSSVKIKSQNFVRISNKLSKKKEEILFLIDNLFKERLKEISEYSDLLFNVSKTIAEIDFINSSSQVSKKNGYCRPVILEKESYISAKDLRHPIIEQLSSKEYIPNDVKLGRLLIYGINAVGKSSLLRSIGLSVIMAQAGLFVPARKYKYSIFKKIYSKISVTDDQNLEKSTFMVELETIQDIARNVDSSSLVISDELCCSTESDSAHALVASVLEHLLESDCKFVFATHLQKLLETPSLINSPSLDILHFDANFENGVLKSTRKLIPGGLKNNYGLEFAKSWGLDEKIIKRSFEIRNETLKESEIYSSKVSRYNKQVFMDSCANCGSKKNLHTHHIKFQSEANSEGLIENRFNKNIKSNLLVLCEECHKKIHSEN